MTINYASFVKAAKLAARDVLRGRWTLNLLGDLKGATDRLTGFEKAVKAADVALATVEFKRAQAVKFNDPRVTSEEDYTKELEAATAAHKQEVKLLNREIEDVTEEIDAINKQIADVQSGVLKVKYENMCEIAKEMVRSRIGKDFDEGEYDKAAGDENDN